jgi:hypothetical protein
LLVAVTGPGELAGAGLVASVVPAGFNAIDWELVMFGFASAGAFGGITLTLTNGGFEFAHANACRLVSKNLSITIALRS